MLAKKDIYKPQDHVYISDNISNLLCNTIENNMEIYLVALLII